MFLKLKKKFPLFIKICLTIFRLETIGRLNIFYKKVNIFIYIKALSVNYKPVIKHRPIKISLGHFKDCKPQITIYIFFSLILY